MIYPLSAYFLELQSAHQLPRFRLTEFGFLHRWHACGVPSARTAAQYAETLRAVAFGILELARSAISYPLTMSRILPLSLYPTPSGAGCQ